ncbi:MAG: phosphoenolpyruvate--protein phosphotransferase, partial [Phycisphaerales bacterium]|nr:phosphoenolpyruvate--protein phosphotransferase [Phycisphaerales bacterium]
MHTLRGIPVSPGFVIGKVFVIEDESRLRVKKRDIDPADIPAELERYEFARNASIGELNDLHKTAADEMGKEAAKIFLFHIGVLCDPSVLTPIRTMIEEEQVNAEYAISATFGKLSAKFANHPDSTFQSKVDDLRDLASRQLRNLETDQKVLITNIKEGTVILARDLTPSQTAGFDRTKVAAFVTELGGPTSHTAIVAGALNLPAVVGVHGLLSQVSDGQRIIVDGHKGQIILDPDEETIDRYHQAQLRARQVSLSLHEYVKLPAITADGVRINLLGNIEFAEEIDQIVDNGGTGIGLYRTEFLFLTRKTEPTEEDHYKAYAECVKQLDGKPLTIRTIDLGADKYTQEQEENPERNPYLGLRSIRYCLAHQDIFRTQLRAILRASAHGPIKVMFPLITNIAEFRTGKYFIHEEME